MKRVYVCVMCAVGWGGEGCEKGRGWIVIDSWWWLRSEVCSTTRGLCSEAGPRIHRILPRDRKVDDDARARLVGTRLVGTEGKENNSKRKVLD